MSFTPIRTTLIFFSIRLNDNPQQPDTEKSGNSDFSALSAYSAVNKSDLRIRAHQCKSVADSYLEFTPKPRIRTTALVTYTPRPALVTVNCRLAAVFTRFVSGHAFRRPARRRNRPRLQALHFSSRKGTRAHADIQAQHSLWRV